MRCEAERECYTDLHKTRPRFVGDEVNAICSKVKLQPGRNATCVLCGETHDSAVVIRICISRSSAGRGGRLNGAAGEPLLVASACGGRTSRWNRWPCGPRLTRRPDRQEHT